MSCSYGEAGNDSPGIAVRGEPFPLPRAPSTHSLLLPVLPAKAGLLSLKFQDLTVLDFA
jgi:hypothetical protein